MKNILIAVVLIATVFTQKSFALPASAIRNHTTKQDQLPQLLTSYYHIKNALVAGNAGDAAKAATSFIKAAHSVDDNAISKSTVNKLLKDAGKISQSSDIKKQREYFAGFSASMTDLAKTVKLTDQPVYIQYCPMQKASWLSNEQSIKNPYYGNSMLSCGKVTDTIQ
ncbi:hypothetical protein BH11BAC3_BH11BAC3_07140 [soil metagenome]